MPKGLIHCSTRKDHFEGSVQNPDSFFLFVCFVLFCFSRQGFSIALADLKLILQTRLASNSEICLPLPPKCWDQRRAPPLPGAFLIALFDCLESNFLSSLYILDISPLSHVGLLKIFSQPVACRFVLLTVSFALQKHCNIMQTYLLIQTSRYTTRGINTVLLSSSLKIYIYTSYYIEKCIFSSYSWIVCSDLVGLPSPAPS